MLLIITDVKKSSIIFTCYNEWEKNHSNCQFQFRKNIGKIIRTHHSPSLFKTDYFYLFWWCSKCNIAAKPNAVFLLNFQFCAFPRFSKKCVFSQRENSHQKQKRPHSPKLKNKTNSSIRTFKFPPIKSNHWKSNGHKPHIIIHTDRSLIQRPHHHLLPLYKLTNLLYHFSIIIKNNKTVFQKQRTRERGKMSGRGKGGKGLGKGGSKWHCKVLRDNVIRDAQDLLGERDSRCYDLH